MSELVAVTGAEGFIGSHLTEALVRKGYRVRAMALYNMFSSGGWLDTLDPEIASQVEIDGRFFQAYDENGAKVKPERVAKPSKVVVWTPLQVNV